MDDNNLIKSDNSDTQRLCLKVNLRVDSAICPRDRTVTQPLHDNANTDELTAHLALAVMDLIHFARPPCEDSAKGCTPSARTLSCASSKQLPPSRGTPSNALPTPTLAQLDDLMLDLLVKPSPT